MIEAAILIVAVFILGPALIWTCEWIDDLMEDRERLNEPAVYTQVVSVLRSLPEMNATTSRDFGRGYAKAIRDAVAVIEEYHQPVDSYADRTV